MGLPMWRAPSPEPRETLKTDPTAPARSPIRRRRSPLARARPTRSPRSPRLLDSDLVSLSRLAHADGPANAARSSRARPPPPPVPESRNYSRPARSSLSWAAATADEDSFSRLTRSYSRPSSDANTPRELSPEDPSQLPALTPNFAPAAASRSARQDSAHNIRERQSQERAEQRSEFYRRIAARRNLPMPPHRVQRSRTTAEPAWDGDEDSSDNNAVGFPPLRRMGRRTIADGPLPSSSLREGWSPATDLDGLGDRERSISPVDDHWEIMLTSVVSDPLPPTADSSFTSAAASASFSNSHPSSRAGSSNSNSAASSRTHLTIPSQRHSPANDLFMRACDTSEDDTASDTEEEDLDHPETTLRIHAHRASPYGPSPRTAIPSSRDIRDRARESRAYVRGFYGEMASRTELERQPERRIDDQPDGSAEERNRSPQDVVLDQELLDARALLERLARRDDISDEFWASVGLRRPLADRIERFERVTGNSMSRFS